MNRPRRNVEWSVVLFVMALLAFNPPMLSIFSVPDLIFGVPTLYLYISVAWGGVIALLAVNLPRLMADGAESASRATQPEAADPRGRHVRYQCSRPGSRCLSPFLDRDS